MEIVIYASDQFFNQKRYGAEAVQPQSQFYKMQMDQTKPSYVEAYVTENSVEDETSFVQVGQQEEYTFY